MKWRDFPILVKEEVMKNMNISERLSLSTYCKTSRNLLGVMPNHLDIAKIIDGFFVIDDQMVSREVFCSLIASQNSTIRVLGLFVESNADKSTINEIFEKGKLMKVKRLVIRFHAEFSESCRELIEICDPSVLKSIDIPRLCTNEVYLSILNTEQWKRCESVRLNTDSSARHSSSLQVNYDHFSHFKNYLIGVDSLSVEEAWRLIQKYRTFTETATFHVTTRQRFQTEEILERMNGEVNFRLGENVRALRVPTMPRYCLHVQSMQFRFLGIIRILVSYRR